MKDRRWGSLTRNRIEQPWDGWQVGREALYSYDAVDGLPVQKQDVILS